MNKVRFQRGEEVQVRPGTSRWLSAVFLRYDSPMMATVIMADGSGSRQVKRDRVRQPEAAAAAPTRLKVIRPDYVNLSFNGRGERYITEAFIKLPDGTIKGGNVARCRSTKTVIEAYVKTVIKKARQVGLYEVCIRLSSGPQMVGVTKSQTIRLQVA